MGGGSWSSSTYDRVTGAKMRSGSTFGYTSEAFRTGIRKAHESLDPLKAGNPTIRESRDGVEHPESTPIAIAFDVTGSVGSNPSYLQSDLKNVFGMLVRKDIVPDPQISIVAYGDAYCDDVPLQVGQFESDNRIDDELDNVFIEGGGGGNGGETSTLAALYLAENTRTDAWEKRGKKGYCFFIGDEKALDLKASQIRDFMGSPDPSNVTAAEAFRKLQEKWNVWFLLIDNGAAKLQRSESCYKDLLGSECVIKISDGHEAPATIVSIIGAMEETTDYATLPEDLMAAGFSESQALAAVDATKGMYGGAGTDDGKNAVVPVDDSYGDLGL